MQYIVWREDTQDETCGTAIEAPCGYDAAERWAKGYDVSTGEYPIIGGEEVIVCVKRTKCGTVERYRVIGQSVPVYTASRIALEITSGDF